MNEPCLSDNCTSKLENVNRKHCYISQKRIKQVLHQLPIDKVDKESIIKIEWTVEDVRGKVQSKFNEDIAKKFEGKCKYKLK